MESNKQYAMALKANTKVKDSHQHTAKDSHQVTASGVVKIIVKVISELALLLQV